MGNNTKKSCTQIINICWKPLFAAIMTGILAEKTSINSILLGTVLGIAAAIACYLDVKRILKQKEENLPDAEKDL